MTDYYQVDEVLPSPQFGSTGPQGWGFTLWSEFLGDEATHRKLLEKLVASYPDSTLNLPAWSDEEDLIEGSLVWQGEPVWVWFETILSHLWLWTDDRSKLVSIRQALISLTK